MSSSFMPPANDLGAVVPWWLLSETLRDLSF